MDNENQQIEKPLCPHCFAEYEEGVDFCNECGCPLGATVGIDPIKRILSQGWVYRRAVSGPISKSILLAMWLIFGTPLFFLFFKEFWGNWPVMGSAIISIIILYRVTKNYFKHKKFKDEDAD